MQWTLVAMVWCALGAEQPDTVVVCPPVFEKALSPWMAYRVSQGHRVAVVSGTQSALDIRATIRRHAESGRLRFVLLVGDAGPAAGEDASAAEARCTPTHKQRAKVNIQWGSEPELATDSWYADLDDDGLPDLAVGRITADDEADLGRIVRKILTYEEAPLRGVWRRQIHLVAGLGGFGTLTDAVIEMAAKKLLADGIPAGYETSMTYGSWQSPYCPDPRLFRAITLQRLNSGGLFWVYLGHGHARGLDELQVPGGSFPILEVPDAGRLRCVQGPPIAVLLACYAGAFDRPTDCLAEELLRAPGGPVAVLCGSRVTMPYAMAVLGEALLDECFRQKRETLGELVLHAKRRLASDDPGNPQRGILDAVAAALSPSPESLREERLEHVALFNLLGDPLLRMHHPQELEVRTESTVSAGGRLRVAVRGASQGTGVIELVCRRDRLKSVPPERPQFVPREAFLRSMTDTYRAANDGVWLSQSMALEDGRYETELTVPAAARGPCHVRVFLAASGRWALGAADVFVRRPDGETVAERGPKVVR